MSQQRLSSGARIRWRGVIYQIIRLLRDSVAARRNVFGVQVRQA